MWKSVIYAITVLALSLAAYVAVGVYVIVKDPEGRLDLERLTFAPDVISKQTFVRLYPHDALLLGSSRMMEVDPEQVRGVRAYNAAMGGGTPERVRDFVRAFAAEDSVAVIGLDFYMMNEIFTPLEPNYFAEAAAASDPATQRVLGAVLRTPQQQQWFAERSYIFNLGSFVRALSGQSAGRRDAGATGMLPITYLDGQIYNETKLSYDAICRQNPPGCAEQRQRLLQGALNGHFGPYRYSETRTQTLRELRTLLDQKHIRYVVLIHPEHRDFLPTLRDPRLAPLRARFKREVTETFANVCDYSDDAAHADPALFYEWDPYHYLPSAGAQMVNECLARYNVHN